MDSVTWVAELCRALKESKFLTNYTFNIPKSHQNTKKYIDMFLKHPFFDFLSLSHLPLSSHPTSIWGLCDLFLAPRSSKDDTQSAVKTLRAKSVTLLARGWIDSEFSMKHLQEVDLGYCREMKHEGINLWHSLSWTRIQQDTEVATNFHWPVWPVEDDHNSGMDFDCSSSLLSCLLACRGWLVAHCLIACLYGWMVGSF